jgi:preprotein translocase subunit YajC
MTGIVLIVVMLGLMWAVVILPQQRRVKAHERLIAGLEPGMVVMTTSGLFGTLVEVGDDRVLLDAAEGHRLVIDRRSIGMIAPAGSTLAELADVSVPTPPPVDPSSLAARSTSTTPAEAGPESASATTDPATGAATDDEPHDPIGDEPSRRAEGSTSAASPPSPAPGPNPSPTATEKAER